MTANTHIIDENTVKKSMPDRPEDGNKGTFGRALLICGSYSMAGAAIIAARAAIHSGVGIAEIICPHSIYKIVAAAVPEAVFTPINDEPTNDDISAVIKSIKRASAVVIGCGMGQTDYTRQLLYTAVDNSKVPLIIDADGINCLCGCIDILQSALCPVILTPHPGEMARLCGCDVNTVQSNRLDIALRFAAEHNVTLVLKGHRTIVAQPDGTAGENHCGNAGMATAGSGDMLCGILAALLSQGMSEKAAAEAAVYIHAKSGDISAAKYSKMYTTPTTMTKCLAEVYKSFENNP